MLAIVLGKQSHACSLLTPTQLHNNGPLSWNTFLADEMGKMM